MDEKLAELAQRIYTEVDGSDHKQHRAELTQEIYDWLYNGSEIRESDTVEILAAEWRAYQRAADEAF